MKLDRSAVPMLVSKLLGGRPVRWGKLLGSYDGSERTLEIFDADGKEQRDLRRSLRPVRADLDEAAGGPVVIVFHTRGESRRLYSEVIEGWYRRRIAAYVAEWIEERAGTELPLRAGDIESFRMGEAA